MDRFQEAARNREQIAIIRGKLISGQITYDQAKILAEPIISRINNKAKEVARKHKVKPKYVDFTNLMR